MKTNRKELETLLAEIASLLNQSVSYDHAVANGHDKYLYLEYASVYGGYRAVNVGIKNGAHYGAFGESSCVARRKASDMYNFLLGIHYGIEFNSKRLQAV